MARIAKRWRSWFRYSLIQGLGAAVALIVLVGTPSSAQAVYPADPPSEGNLSFRVLRDGDEIGTQTLQFLRSGDRVVVRTTIDIEVKVAFITAYRFHMKAEEVWANGKLVQFSSRTDDDGTPRNVLVKARQEGDERVLAVSANGKQSEAPGTALPASMWNPRMLQQTLLLDVLRGKPLKVRITDKGDETVRIDGRPMPARHYAVRGQLERDIWYGADGHILRFAFQHKDGSEIVFERRL